MHQSPDAEDCESGAFVQGLAIEGDHIICDAHGAPGRPGVGESSRETLENLDYEIKLLADTWKLFHGHVSPGGDPFATTLLQLYNEILKPEAVSPEAWKLFHHNSDP